jgi:hypothetical protein
VLGIVAVVFLVILAIGYVGSPGGSGSDDYSYGDYGSGWDYEVQVNEVADPWEPPDGGQEASRGYRFVAIDVVVEASRQNDEAYPTGAYDFKLTDDEEFAYGPLDSAAKPAFPAEVWLEPGEKARGWVTFEVAEGHALVSLASYETVVSLTDDDQTRARQGVSLRLP